MFVNVDWFFLSHRLPIANQAKSENVCFRVYTDFTKKHCKKDYPNFDLLQSPLKRRPESFFSEINQAYKAFILILRSKPDLIHAVTIKPIIYMGIISFILRKPFVASVSGLGPIFNANNIYEKIRLRIVTLVYKFIFSRKKITVICQSNHDINTLLQKKILSKDKLVLIEGSGVDVEKYYSIKKNNSKKVNILMASRILKSKGIMEYCKASEVLSKNYNYDLNFMLAGPIDISNQEHIISAELEMICLKSNINYLGNLSNLPELLSRVDIFVLPSYYPEGLPKVLIEAAASECAVITTDHPGCRDAIIENETGLLVRPKDPDSIINAIKKLLDNRLQIEIMGKKGRLLAISKFSVNHVIEKHYEIYNRYTINKK